MNIICYGLLSDEMLETNLDILSITVESKAICEFLWTSSVPKNIQIG